MNWTEAVDQMMAGKAVRRVSESIRTCVAVGAMPIYDEGVEPTILADATDAGGTRCKVFMGAWSRCLFDPDDNHKAGDDWIVVPL